MLTSVRGAASVRHVVGAVDPRSTIRVPVASRVGVSRPLADSAYQIRVQDGGVPVVRTGDRHVETTGVVKTDAARDHARQIRVGDELRAVDPQCMAHRAFPRAGARSIARRLNGDFRGLAGCDLQYGAGAPAEDRRVGVVVDGPLELSINEVDAEGLLSLQRRGGAAAAGAGSVDTSQALHDELGVLVARRLLEVQPCLRRNDHLGVEPHRTCLRRRPRQGHRCVISPP